ncbi:MAG: DUF983 domain-containing protein [Pseudomonadota bacterium]
MKTPNPFLAGLRARCPKCGEGVLFSGYLKIADQCPVCGLDFSGEDAGDGPAVFIIFIAGAILVPLALIVELAFTPPLLVHAVLWTPLTMLICLALLRPFKATLFALQYQNAAREARLDDDLQF